MNHLQRLYKASQLVSQLKKNQIKFDERFKVTSVPFFVPDFNLLCCELDNFNLKCYTELFSTIILKQNKFTLQYSHASL